MTGKPAIQDTTTQDTTQDITQVFQYISELIYLNVQKGRVHKPSFEYVFRFTCLLISKTCFKNSSRDDIINIVESAVSMYAERFYKEGSDWDTFCNWTDRWTLCFAFSKVSNDELYRNAMEVAAHAWTQVTGQTRPPKWKGRPRIRNIESIQLVFTSKQEGMRFLVPARAASQCSELLGALIRASLYDQRWPPEFVYAPLSWADPQVVEALACYIKDVWGGTNYYSVSYTSQISCLSAENIQSLYIIALMLNIMPLAFKMRYMMGSAASSSTTMKK